MTDHHLTVSFSAYSFRTCEPICEATTSARLTCLTYVDDKTPEVLLADPLNVASSGEFCSSPECITELSTVRAQRAQQAPKAMKPAAGNKAKRKAAKAVPAPDVQQRQNGARLSTCGPCAALSQALYNKVT